MNRFKYVNFSIFVILQKLAFNLFLFNCNYYSQLNYLFLDMLIL